MKQQFRVWFSNLTGCAVGISDFSLTIKVTAESEPAALELALAEACRLNVQSGLPPHGLHVGEEELRRLAVVLPVDSA